MATMLPRSGLLLKQSNLSGVLFYVKYDGAFTTCVRRHHIAQNRPDVNLLKQSRQKKGFLGHLITNESGILSASAVRFASTGVHDADETFVNTSSSVHGSNETFMNTSSSLHESNETFMNTSSSVHGSNETFVNTFTSLDSIPEPPIPLSEEVVEILKVTGEASFVSQGLGGWSPVGLVQHCMEYLHIGCDIPWWASIMIGTIVVRTIIFPLVIVAQRNAAKMNNHLPQLQVLQMKMTEARQSGNQLEAARYGQEMMLFMQEKQLNPLKNMLVPLAQAPLFISFFLGLRGMSNVPVDSMRQGGLFWFEDLTMPDQYFILPVITSATMWLTIEIGTDSARLSAANMNLMKYVLRALPICILPFTVNFPGAILCYWVSTNFISLCQVGFLRIPSVREYFKIEKLVTHSPDALPVKSKGFVKGMKESWTNLKITKEIEERQRFDEMAFQRAGKGAVQKTFKYNPTQPRQAGNSSTVRAKPKD